MPSPFGLLSAALDDLVTVGLLRPEVRPGFEMTAWSAAQVLDHVEAALLVPPSGGRTRAARPS